MKHEDMLRARKHRLKMDIKENPYVLVYNSSGDFETAYKRLENGKLECIHHRVKSLIGSISEEGSNRVAWATFGKKGIYGKQEDVFMEII